MLLTDHMWLFKVAAAGLMVYDYRGDVNISLSSLSDYIGGMCLIDGMKSSVAQLARS